MKKTEPPKDILELLDNAQELLQALEGDHDGMCIDDCLQLFAKDDLAEMIRTNGYAVKTSLKKSEMIQKLTQEITKRFQLYVDHMPLEEYFCLNMCLNNHDMDFDDDLYVVGMPFFSQGFIYFLQSSVADEWKLVFPKELIAIFLRAITEENLELCMKRQMLCMIMRGLAMIYGVYPKQQLEIVWKHILREEKELLTNGDAKETEWLKSLDALFSWENVRGTIESCIFFSKLGNTGFEVFSDHIMVDGLSEDRYYVDILKDSQGKDYYMPSLTEILYYAENEFDVNGTPYLKLKQYFIDKSDLDPEDIEDLMDDLCSIYTEDSGIRLAMEAIDDAGVVFDSERDVEEILPLLANLSNSTRKWCNKGYTPNELAAQKTAIPLRKPLDNVIPFPTGRTRKPPSPKGSGPKHT